MCIGIGEAEQARIAEIRARQTKSRYSRPPGKPVERNMSERSTSELAPELPYFAPARVVAPRPRPRGCVVRGDMRLPVNIETWLPRVDSVGSKGWVRPPEM